MHKIHLDTDLGGDIDDLCALALLLRWPEDLQLTGITTVAEAAGKRAGYVRHVLALEGRQDTPVAAGADVAQGFYRYAELGYPAEERYWSTPIAPSPGAPEAAIHLLKQSVEQGATIVAIGPFTNLYLLEQTYPGILAQAELFLMGGYVYPPRPGLPAWGNDMDWNIQVDVRSAHEVLRASNPTLIPLSVTLETALRRSHLDALRQSGGALGRLIARQAEAFSEDQKNETVYGATCPGLPADLINFQHDPLACAIALGWREGVEIEELPLIMEAKDGWLAERVDPAGRPMRVVTGVDGAAFSEFWLKTLTQR